MTTLYTSNLQHTSASVSNMYLDTNGNLTVAGQLTVANKYAVANTSIPSTWFPSGHRVLLNTISVAGVALGADTTSMNNSIYKDYEIIFENLLPSVTSMGIYLQMYASGAYQATSYVSYMAIFNGGSAAYSPTTYIDLAGSTRVSNGTGHGMSGSCKFFNPSSTAHYKTVITNTAFFDSTSGGGARTWGGGSWASTTAVTGFKVYTSAGSNFTSGSIRVYGIRA